MMKPVSFSLAAAEPVPKRTKQVHDAKEETAKEYITEFSTRDSSARAPEQRRVIPSKPNRLVTKKKEDDPSALGKIEERFEKAAVRETVGDGVYGLVEGKAQRTEHTRSACGAPQVTMSSITDDLPDAPTAEYEDMPVDQFAAALLRGMGLKKHLVVPTVDYAVRPSRMGLGAKVGEMSTRLLNSCSCSSVRAWATPATVIAGTKKRSHKDVVGSDGSAKGGVKVGDHDSQKSKDGDNTKQPERPRKELKAGVNEGSLQQIKLNIHSWCHLNETGRARPRASEGTVRIRLLLSHQLLNAVVLMSCERACLCLGVCIS